MSELVVCGFTEARFSTRCQRCGLPMWEDDTNEPRFCPDCREWLKQSPHPQRGVKRGPRYRRSGARQQ